MKRIIAILAALSILATSLTAFGNFVKPTPQPHHEALFRKGQSGIGKVPKGMPKVLPLRKAWTDSPTTHKLNTWEQVITSLMQSYQHGWKDARAWNKDSYAKIAAPIAWAMLGNDWSQRFYDYSKKQAYNEMIQKANRIYNSPRTHAKSLLWLLPTIMVHASRLTKKEQKAQLAALRHGMDYLAHFDLKREKAYHNKLKNGRCKEEVRNWCLYIGKKYRRGENDAKVEKEAQACAARHNGQECMSYFTMMDPVTKEIDPYRKLEAWYYRRIVNNKIPPTKLKSYTAKVYWALGWVYHYK